MIRIWTASAYLIAALGLRSATLPAAEGLPAGAVARLGTLQGRIAGSVPMLSPDGKVAVFVTALRDEVVVLDAANGKEIRRIALDEKAYPRLGSFTADSKRLAVLTGGNLKLFELATGKVRGQVLDILSKDAFDYGIYITLSADGNRALYVDVDADKRAAPFALLFDVTGGKKLAYFHQQDSHFDGILSADGKTIATFAGNR